jgi:hypothetical protein
VRELMRPFDIPIVIVVVALAGFFIYRRLKARGAERVAPAEETSD